MPTPTELYRAALRRARESAYTIGRGSYDVLLRDFAATLSRLEATATAAGLAPITRKQAADLAAEMKRFLSLIAVQTGSTTEAAARLTINRVSEFHQSALRGIGGDEIAGRLGSIQGDAFAVYRARNGTALDFETLMRRRTLHAADEVDRLMEGMLLSGQSSQTAKIQLARIIGANEPRVLSLMEARSAVRAGDLSPEEYRALGFGPSDFSRLRSLMYDARRITVSETNNALREVNRLALTRSPVVRAVRWQTSGNHQDVDECDVLEDANIYGLGQGMYPPENMPLGPHPHCACTAGTVDMLPPSQWATGRPASGPPKFQGLYHSVRRLGFKGNVAARIRDNTRQVIRAGFIAPVEDAVQAAKQAAAGVVQSAKTAAKKLVADFAQTAAQTAELALQDRMRGSSFSKQLESYGSKFADALGIQVNTWTVKKLRVGLAAYWNASTQIAFNSAGFKRLKGLHGLLDEAGIDLKRAIELIDANDPNEMLALFGARIGISDADTITAASRKVKELRTGLRDLRTLIHESYHGLSDKFGSATGDYFGVGKALEEGLVEYNARSSIAWFVGKNWNDISKAPVGTTGLAEITGAYDEWVRSTSWIAETLGGEETIERIFKAGERSRRYNVIKAAWNDWIDAEIIAEDAAFGDFLKREFEPNRLTFLIYTNPDKFESFRDAWRAGATDIAKKIIDGLNQQPFNPAKA